MVYNKIYILETTMLTLVRAMHALVLYVNLEMITFHNLLTNNLINAFDFHIATAFIGVEMVFQSLQLPHLLTPLLVVSAANLESVDLADQRLIKNVCKVLFATVWARLQQFLRDKPTSETGVTVVLSAALGEARVS